MELFARLLCLLMIAVISGCGQGVKTGSSYTAPQPGFNELVAQKSWALAYMKYTETIRDLELDKGSAESLIKFPDLITVGAVRVLSGACLNQGYIEREYKILLEQEKYGANVAVAKQKAEECSDKLKAYDDPFWEPFPGYSAEQRAILTTALERYDFKYDNVDRVIRFDPPATLRRDKYYQESFVSVRGLIDRVGARGSLMVRYFGSDWLFVQSLTVAADDKRWDVKGEKFYTDNDTKVREQCFLDLSNPKYKEIALAIASSKSATIRFRGKQYYYDLEVSEEMKTDIRSVLDAMKM